MPFDGELPKSGCTGEFRPIAWIIAAESDATGSVFTFSFHTFVAGKIGHRGTVER